MEQNALVLKHDFPKPVLCSRCSKGSQGPSHSSSQAFTSTDHPLHELMGTVLSLHAHFDDQDTRMCELHRQLTYVIS